MATPDKPDMAEPAEPAPARLSFPVVGIGASAGGLEALEALTQRLRPDRIAFVVMQHLAPSHVSMLAEILKRGTSLRVVTVDERMRLEPGVLYVASPKVEVALEGEELKVAAAGAGQQPRHTIDAFLRSLAKSGGRWPSASSCRARAATGPSGSGRSRTRGGSRSCRSRARRRSRACRRARSRPAAPTSRCPRARSATS